MQPLRDVRVLDLSRLLPGSFASLVLADLGARVDKLEDPLGDPLRHLPPLVGGESAIFAALNRDKRSACLDLKKPRARRATLAMLRRYDVIIDPFRPGVLDRLGLAHDTMRAQNPRLIVCALTGYGQSGPLALRAGHDINYLARAGVLGMQGPAGAPPAPFAAQIADIGGALWSVVAVVGALRERDRTGQGCVLDIAMTEASAAFAWAGIAAALAGEPPARGGHPLSGGLAAYGAYLTKDGEVVTIGALEPKFWRAFCRGVGREADADDLRPGPHQARLEEALRAVFASRTRAEWEAFSREHDCCVEGALRPDELLGDEQLASRGVFFELQSAGGRLVQLRTPLTPRDGAHARAPARGEHTDVVLREAGVDEGEIAAMRADGAIA
ncbi:MAG TPA: CaiB/BaiF CoA-transferase family protein [Polyangiaceae bacterium]|nr:CaiB/BaiF CoA-transferase family protein [Polyangiaceae bacterium]